MCNESVCVEKVDANKYSAWSVRYFLSRARQQNNLRLGQAFMNEFLPRHADPELFYCTDNARAMDLIFRRYIQ